MNGVRHHGQETPPQAPTGERTRRVVRTKLRPPRPTPTLIPRSRLLRRFDDPLPRLTLISAPAGFGKTELVAEWVRSNNRPTAWLSLDAQDQEPARFFPHLGAAVEAFPGSDALASILNRATGEVFPGVDSEVVPAWEEMEEEGTLILDDLHELEDGPTSRWVGTFLEAVQGGPRVILLTRIDPPLPLGRLRVAGEVQEIREHDLRFTPDEAASLLERLRPDGLSVDLVARLEERTEGWAAGLKLAAIALADAPDPEKVVAAFDGSHRFVADYLMEEALGTLDPKLQRFLLDTSILPQLTPGNCSAVTGLDREEARALLGEVEKRSLFLIAMERRDEIFRYHQLFAELLSFRLKKEDPERYERLRQTAAEWFHREGDVFEALAQASHLGDRRILLGLLDRHGFGMLARGEFASFGRWLSIIPDPPGQPFPLFLMTLAWYRMLTERSSDLSGPLEIVDRALEAIPPDYEPERKDRVRYHALVIRAFGLRLAERLEEAREASEEALTALPENETWFRGIVLFSLAAVFLRSGDMPEARARLEEAFEVNRAGGPPYLVLASLAHLCAVIAQVDGLDRALSRLEAAEAFAEGEGLARIPAMGVIHCIRALIHFLEDDLSSAEDSARKAIPLSDEGQEPDVHGNALIQLSRALGASGKLDEANQALDEAEALAHRYSVKPYSSSFKAERARLALLRGDPAVAFTLLGFDPRQGPTAVDLEETGLPGSPGSTESGTDLVGETIRSTPQEMESLVLLTALMTGENRKSLDPLARWILTYAEPKRRGVAVCMARLALAMAGQDSGDRGEEWQHLEQSLVLAHARRYVRPYLEGGDSVRSLLQAGFHHLQDSRARAMAKDLLQRFEARGEAVRIPREAQEMVEPLTDRESEVLQQLAKGLSNKALARALFVSLDTVKTHLKNVYAKLQVSNRRDAVDRGRQLGLIPGDPDEIS